MEEEKIIFQKASKLQKKWALLVRGTSGAGKTYSALMLAKELAGKDGKVCLVDTENISSTHYANKFDFDVVDYNTLSNNNHDPKGYFKIIDLVIENGYKVLIIDSFSHVWNGRNGILEIVENLSQTEFKTKSGYSNSFGAWIKGNKMYKDLIDKIVMNGKIHIICTGRTKQAYDMEGGKPIKKGMELQQRDGIEYEFDAVINVENSKPGFATVEKDRTGVFNTDGELLIPEVGQRMLNYYDKK
mgnify:CR=1 FL=1